MVEPLIKMKKTCMRQPIPAEERLAITLRFLATGETSDLLMYQFRVHRITIAKIVLEVCQAIYQVFMPTYMIFPTKEDDWLQICNATFERWNFPNCSTAADGKHIVITKPINSGSMYYNYKGFFSIVLLAMVHYDYEILAVDVACQGRISDGGVFGNSCLYFAFKCNKVNLPKARALPNTIDNIEVDNLPSPEVPLEFAADNAFS